MLSIDELLDTALVLESLAEESGPDCNRIYLSRAKKFRDAASNLVAALSNESDDLYIMRDGIYDEAPEM